ncbi:MAG: OsmC family protein [Oricola sp.]
MNAPVKPEKIAMNGVDVPTLLATIGAVNEHRDLARFTFRANGAWLNGTHSRININGYFGAGAEQGREADLVMEGDHPGVLCGTDKAPTPVEFLLAALSACITAGIGNIASARQVKLEAVETTVEGDINLLGILGLSDEVRNGYNGIRATFRIKGDAPADKLRQIVEQSVARSAVYDVLTNGVPVSIDIEAA